MISVGDAKANLATTSMKIQNQRPSEMLLAVEIRQIFFPQSGINPLQPVAGVDTGFVVLRFIISWWFTHFYLAITQKKKKKEGNNLRKESVQ